MILSLRHHASDTNSLHYVKFLGVTLDSRNISSQIKIYFIVQNKNFSLTK